MKLILPLISVFFCITNVVARPKPHQLSKRIDPPLDSTEALILNYALALEHLENAFYAEALQRFNQSAFTSAGYNAFARGRFVQISEHEQAHVKILNQTLGANATKPCNYTFPYTNVRSFAALSQLLEGVGTSAYIGALQNISTPEYLSVAASILSTEARHAAWVASVANKFSPWNGPFDTGLTPNQTFTLAKSFIIDCPADNPPLNLNAFPTLNVSRGFPGKNITFRFDSSLATSLASNTGTGNATQLYAVFFTGLAKEFVPLMQRDGSPLTAGGSNTTGGTNNSSSSVAESTTSSGASATSEITTESETTTVSETSIASETSATTSSNTESVTSVAPSVTPVARAATSDISSVLSSATFISSDLSSAISSSSAPSSPTTSAPPASTPSVLMGTAAVPSGVQGQIYVVVAANDTIATDDTIVAGPAALIFQFSSNGNVTVQSSP